MKKTFLTFLLLAIMPFPAAASDCSPDTTEGSVVVCLQSPATTCPVLGVTTMDGDKKNIIACLLDDTGNKVWKPMTQSGDETPKIIDLGLMPAFSGGTTADSGFAERNFGKNWNYISMTGSFGSTDNGPAGGFISKALNKAALASATGAIITFTLNTFYQCSYASDATAMLCARLDASGNLWIGTGGKIHVVYSIQ